MKYRRTLVALVAGGLAAGLLAPTALAADGGDEPPEDPPPPSEKALDDTPGDLPEAAATEAAPMMVTTAATTSSLSPFYSASGSVRLSLDAAGTLATESTATVQKPAGASLRKAFLFAATTGGRQYVPQDGEVAIDGAMVSWDPAHTIETSISSYNAVADVTDMIRAKLDAAPAGPVEFVIAEGESSWAYDGTVLALVMDDPSLGNDNTVALLYGAQQTTGDQFNVLLGEPVDTSDPDFAAGLSLGISFGHQPSGQFSEVDVNGERLTTSAGGHDDGEGADGALITVGGVGDTVDNPADPHATDGCGLDPRCDDELYDLTPFLEDGDTSLVIDTRNPSADDNVFLAAIDLRSAIAVVGEGAVLTPSDHRAPVGSQHTLTARLQDDDGQPVAGRAVEFEVVSGPNAGRTATADTAADGTATFSFSSAATGTDAVVARFTDSRGDVQTSNTARVTWTDEGDGCVEDGLQRVPAAGIVSGLVHDNVEGPVSDLHPPLGPQLHSLNCETVVPAEDTVDDLVGQLIG